MYNLLEHTDNDSVTSGSLWNYYKDEINNDENENDNNNNRLNKKQNNTSKSFRYRATKIGITPDNGNRLNTRSCCSIKTFKLFLEIS